MLAVFGWFFFVHYLLGSKVDPGHQGFLFSGTIWRPAMRVNNPSIQAAEDAGGFCRFLLHYFMDVVTG